MNSVEYTIEHVYVENIGWGLFASDDAVQIERVDEYFGPDDFSDLTAEWLVHFLAADGDEAALQVLGEITYSGIDDAFRYPDA